MSDDVQGREVARRLFAAEFDDATLSYSEGEEERVLRAVQLVIDEGLARPVLIGRREVVRRRIEKLGLRLSMDEDFELTDPEDRAASAANEFPLGRWGTPEDVGKATVFLASDLSAFVTGVALPVDGGFTIL